MASSFESNDYSDISLCENWEIFWAKVLRGDSGILRILVKQQEIEAAWSNKWQEIKCQLCKWLHREIVASAADDNV